MVQNMVHTSSRQIKATGLRHEIARLQAELTKLVGADSAELKGAEMDNVVSGPDAVSKVVGALQVAVMPQPSESLQEYTGLDKKTVTITLKSLVGTGTVTKVGQARGTRYSLAGQATQPAGETEPKGAKLIRKRIAPKDLVPTLLAHVDECPKSSEELQKLTGLDKSRLHRALALLIYEGRVTTTGQKRGTKYSLKVS